MSSAAEAGPPAPVEVVEPAPHPAPDAGADQVGSVSPVRFGNAPVGAERLAVFAPAGTGADVAVVTLGGSDVAAELAAARAADPAARVPLLAAPADLPDRAAFERQLGALAGAADGVVVGPTWMADFRRVAAVGRLGLPVLLCRDPHAGLAEWFDAAGYACAAGAPAVVLCETGRRVHAADRASHDLALVPAVRERAGRPVLVDVTTSPGLVGAALAAGADGVFLGAGDAAAVAAARELASLLAPLLRPVEPRTLAQCRSAIDVVDAALAVLLERRAGLTVAAQRIKAADPAATGRGPVGRDAVRERAIVAAMARRAPRLGAARLAPVVDAIVRAGLALAASEQRAARAPAAGEHPRH